MEVRAAERGFTLIELVVAMALCMAILAGATMMYVNGLNEQFSNQAQMSMNTEAQKLATYIDRDVAQGFIIPTTSVTISNPASAAGNYSADGNDLVFQLPSWDNVNNVTISGKYDTIIYQYVTTQTTHKAYNFRRIVSPDPSSSRTASDEWILPYSASRDATNAALYPSDPYASYTGADIAVFHYYVQDTTNPGQVKLQTAETDAYICLVETRFTINKAYHTGWLTTSEDIQSRLRNWKPPGT